MSYLAIIKGMLGGGVGGVAMMMANLLVMKTYQLLVSAVFAVLHCWGSQALNLVLLCPERLHGLLGM